MIQKENIVASFELPLLCTRLYPWMLYTQANSDMLMAVFIPLYWVERMVRQDSPLFYRLAKLVCSLRSLMDTLMRTRRTLKRHLL